MTAPAIRRGAAGDLDRLVEIEEAAFDTDLLSRASLAYALRSLASVLLVAERAGRIVGYGLVNFRKNSLRSRLFSLARDPARLKALRAKLADRATSPLFDMTQFSRDIEALYLGLVK